MGVFGFFTNLKITPAGAPENNTSVMVAERRAVTVNAPAAALVPAAANLPQKTLDELPAQVRAAALERLAFVRLVDARKKAARCTDREAVEYVAINHVIEFPILREGGKNHASALNYSNYRVYKSRIKGYTDQETILRQLCDNYRRGMQERRGDERFWQLFFAMYLNLNKLPLTVAYDRACARMRAEYKDVPVPSIMQVRYQVDHMDPDKLILAREGEEAWRNKCCDFIRRDWLDVAAGECVIGDSRTFDTRIRVWDEDKQRWIAVRPTIAALMDGRSWYVAAYWITAEPVNSKTLIDTMRLYLRATDGVPPPIVYFDNGKDYCAQGFATDFECDGHKHSIFRELGIRLLNSLAYNARAKTIERAFRDMMQQFDKMFPDYLGSRPGQRNLASDYYDNHAEELPSMQQFCEIFAGWLHDYHHRPKGGDIHRGRSPQEIWDTHTNNGRDPLSPERLKMAFYKPEAVRIVGRGPSVKFDNTYYYCDALKWGAKVLIKSDTLDAEHVMCYTLDGALIGEARTRARIHALSGAKDDIRMMMARQRRQLKEARTVIADLSGGNHVYSPLELLLASPDAIGVKGGAIASVKGAAHHYEHHRLTGVIDAPAQPEPEYQEPPEADPEIEAVNAILTRRPESDEISKDELARVHQIITKSKRGDDEDEY